MRNIPKEIREMLGLQVGDAAVLMHEAADEIERLQYVLEGVRCAISTGRNEPLMIWRDQIDIALSDPPGLHPTPSGNRKGER